MCYVQPCSWSHESIHVTISTWKWWGEMALAFLFFVQRIISMFQDEGLAHVAFCKFNYLLFCSLTFCSLFWYTCRAMCLIDFGMLINQEGNEHPNGSDQLLEKYDSSKNARAKQKRRNFDQESNSIKNKKFLMSVHLKTLFCSSVTCQKIIFWY